MVALRARTDAHPDALQQLLHSKHTLLFAVSGRPRGAHTLVSPHVIAFTIYPRSAQDVCANEFLWHAVRNSAFDQRDVRSLAPRAANMYALCLPPQLAAFLSAVSLEEMHRSVLYMLADAAQGEDEQGLQTMHQDLAPDVWKALQQLMACGVGQTAAAHAQHQTASAARHCISHASFMLDEALQSAQAHNYWKIEVQAALFVDETHMLYESATLQLQQRAALIQSLYHDWRHITTNCLIYERDLGARRPNGSNSRCSRERTRNKAILNTMLRLVREDAKHDMWQRVRTVLLCANRRGCLLATVPTQLIRHILIPYIVIDAP